MRLWVEEMQASINRTRAEHAAERAQAEANKAQLFEVRHTPMAARLKAIISAMPATEQVKPRPLSFFVAALAPKYHGSRAHRGEVAEGLRQLGWVRERKWRGEQEGFRALWIPPATEQEGE